MSYVLGIDIGGSTTTAAVCRRADSPGPVGPFGAVQPVPLDGQSTPVDGQSTALESALELTASGSFAAGAGTDAVDVDPTRVVRDFVRRVGDDTPVHVGGGPYLPQALVAALTRWVVDMTWQYEEGPAEQVVLCHPASWGTYRRDLLLHALHEVELPHVAVLPGAAAAAISHEATGWLPGGGLVAVYRLGGRGVEASVLEHVGPGGFRVLAVSELEGVGGAALNDALVAHVRTEVGDIADPALGRRCASARERLSTATETAIEIPGRAARSAELWISRPVLDRLARPILRAGIDALMRTIRSCGVGPGQLSAVLLAGGTARTPLVGELLDAELSCPVLCADNPQLTAASGAALAAGYMLRPPELPELPARPAPPAGSPGPLPAPPAELGWSSGPGGPDGSGWSSGPGGPDGSGWVDRPDWPPPRYAAPGSPEATAAAQVERPERPPVQVSPLEVAGRDVVATPYADAGLARAGRRLRGRR